jgi:hypothetical protein
MSRIPTAIGVAALVAVAINATAFISNSGQIAQSSAVMILVGLMEILLAGLAGLLLVRAPWSRWLLGTAVVASALLASIGESALFWFGIVVTGIAMVGISGPWLTLWVRRQPVAEQLGAIPVALIASAGVAPIVVGLAAYQGVVAIHWMLIFLIVVSAWAYGRGLFFGIWGFRLVVPIVGLISAAQTDEPGNTIIAIGALTLSAMAWSPQSGHVTAVITPPLPAPVRRKDRGDAAG